MFNRHFLAILSVAIVKLFSFPESAIGFAACSGACGTAHHKAAMARFGFDNGQSIEYTDLVPFALTGFGYGIASDPIVLPPNAPNPQLSSATADWIDFRFYANFPGVGIVKGSLNTEQTSYVELNALESDGLFPAYFNNNMFIQLEPLDYPGLVYKNTEALQLEAPSVTSAPPDSSIVTTQIGTDIFNIIGTPPPGAPNQIIFEDGLQSFLDADTGLNLQLLSSRNESLMRFEVENLHDVPLTVAYFLYFNDDAELAELVQSYDGLLNLAPNGVAEFSFDISDIPGVTPENAIVQAMILDPFGITGMDEWRGNATCETVPEPSSILGLFALGGLGLTQLRKKRQ